MHDHNDTALQALGALATGVPAIDNEHAYLVELEGRLKAALQSNDDNEAASVFHELLEYMSEHFSHEETLMDCLTPVNRKRHKEEHANISWRLVQSIGRPGMPARFPIAPGELAAVIATWLENHIRHWDMPLAQIIKSRDSDGANV